MMYRNLIKKIKKAIDDWVQQYPEVKLSDIEVYPSGISDNIHVIVVAKKGFENWEQTERENKLYTFLRARLGDKDIVRIPLLLTLTEEEYENYEWVPPDQLYQA